MVTLARARGSFTALLKNQKSKCRRVWMNPHMAHTLVDMYKTVYYNSAFMQMYTKRDMHTAGTHTGTVNRGDKNRRQHTKERVCVSVYVFWTVCGLKWAIWSQQTGGNTDRSSSNAITTHLRQEEGVRAEGHWLTLREIQMEAAHIFENHFQTTFQAEKKAEGGKWKAEGES